METIAQILLIASYGAFTIGIIALIIHVIPAKLKK